MVAGFATRCALGSRRLKSQRDEAKSTCVDLGFAGIIAAAGAQRRQSARAISRLMRALPPARDGGYNYRASSSDRPKGVI